MRIEQPGVTAFTQLSDVPHSYFGANTYSLVVNSLGTGVEFTPGGTGTASWGSITGTLSSQTDLQTALNAKQDTLVSGTNIKTINGNSVLGSGNLVVTGGASVIETEIDFGSLPTDTVTVTVTDASITPASIVTVTPSGNTATGRVGNDYTWETITFSAIAQAGSFLLSAVCGNGTLVGKRKVFYSYS